MGLYAILVALGLDGLASHIDGLLRNDGDVLLLWFALATVIYVVLRRRQRPASVQNEVRVTVMGRPGKMEAMAPRVDAVRDESERQAMELVYAFLSRGELRGYTRRALVGGQLTDDRWAAVRRALLATGDLVPDGKSARLPEGTGVDEVLARWGIDRSMGQPRYRPQSLDVHRLSALSRLMER